MALIDSVNMPHRVDSQIRSVTRDAVLGSVETWADELTNLPAWVQTASQNEITEFQKRGIVVDTKVYVVSDHGLTAAHRLVFSTRNLEVRSVADASAGLGIIWKVMCEERTAA